ncbi:unnamed protein product [Clonostachys rosea f. rosea IK726]|uniref:Uncharacterized protein n=1 Tax=Clonostachys rosea f. rosea IK726 TaxID=1349383 RepID=A0ACA9UQB9_BIOOC|nr:unnamed protein product [Clonostachys rosea f. rosea IK726]
MFYLSLPNSDQILWASERSGYNHLYMVDLEQGMIQHPITSGAWNFKSIEHIDEKTRTIWVATYGFNKDEDLITSIWSVPTLMMTPPVKLLLKAMARIHGIGLRIGATLLTLVESRLATKDLLYDVQRRESFNLWYIITWTREG